MGMYNEVFVRCPYCFETVCSQISQIVLGFGGFDLNDEKTLEQLDDDELSLLVDIVVENDLNFYCEKCNTSFNFSEISKSNNENPTRQKLLKKLLRR